MDLLWSIYEFILSLNKTHTEANPSKYPFMAKLEPMNLAYMSSGIAHVTVT